MYDFIPIATRITIDSWSPALDEDDVTTSDLPARWEGQIILVCLTRADEAPMKALDILSPTDALLGDDDQQTKVQRGGFHFGASDTGKGAVTHGRR